MILVPEQVVRVPTARSEPLGRCNLELTSFSSPSCSNLSLSSGARQSRMSWDYPNPTLAAEGEGEATLGFSFGRAPGQLKTQFLPFPHPFPVQCLDPAGTCRRKSAGREEELGLGSEAESKLCWCQARSCCSRHGGGSSLRLSLPKPPGTAAPGSSSFLGARDPVQALPSAARRLWGLWEQGGTVRFRSSRAQRQSSH